MKYPRRTVTSSRIEIAPHVDAELTAIKSIINVLEPMTAEARYRILGAVAVAFGFADWSWKESA